MLTKGASVDVPALGRSFHLGMRYDLYRDTPLSGRSLWNSATLRGVVPTTVEAPPSCHIFTDEDRQEKFTNLQIGNHSKLSLLGGFIEVAGSAKYVHDCKSAEDEIRVVLKYSHITHYEEMKTEKFKTVDYPGVLKNNDATHYVSRIVYGCDIFIVFIRSVASDETIEDVKAAMLIHARGIHSLLEQSLSDSSLCNPDTEKITCKCFCDEVIPYRLTTYTEVASRCKEISQRVKQAKIPKLVTLHPIPGRDKKLVQEVNASITARIECIIEELLNLEEKCRRLKETDVCETFVHLEKNMEELENQMERFKFKFVSDLRALIPAARKADTSEDQLSKRVDFYERSPFHYNNLKKYIELKAEEAQLLGSYMNRLLVNQVQEIQMNDLEGFVCKKGHKYDAFLFGFNIGQEEVPFERMHEDYMNGFMPSDPFQELEERMDSIRSLENNLEDYLKFVEENRDKSNTVFGFSSTVLTELNHSAVAFYNEGSLTNLKTLAGPNTLQCTRIGATEVSFTWSLPDYSEEPHHYKVYYIPTEADPEEWSCAGETPDGSRNVTIMNLAKNTKYSFIVRSVFSQYVSLASPRLTVKTDTSYCTII